MDYADAIYPDSARVAGVKLLPMQLGHALLLRRLNSPLSQPRCNGLFLDVGDCALGLFVLSQDQSCAAKRIDSAWGQVRLWWFALRLLPRLFKNKLKLAAYVQRQWQGPDVFVPQERKGDAGDGDALRTIIGTMTSRVGVPMEQVLSLPLTRAMWEVCGYWAQEGSLRFASQQEREIMEFYRRKQHGEAAAGN